MKSFATCAFALFAATQVNALSCNYQGTLYKICMNANAWSYENGSVCVGITRCVQQDPPYGVTTASVTPRPTTTVPMTTPPPTTTTTKPPTTPPTTTKPVTPTPTTITPGSYEPHPTLLTQVCTKSGGCTTEQTKINFDIGYRSKCTNPSVIDSAKCSIPIEDYANKHGVYVNGGQVRMDLFTPSGGLGSRFYVMADDKKYRMYNLVNKELTFDVDTSKMPCGLNGALYFSEMSGNDPGAQYGSGYCDAQCPNSLCCQEMDVWEGNRAATVFTPHPCYHEGPYKCAEPNECGRGDARYQGECDMNGCGLNLYANGKKNYYGVGSSFTVDTSKPFTVVTQFRSTDGTDNGDLSEIKRFYIQNGKRIDTPDIYNGQTSLNANTCAVFGAYNNNVFQQRGGMKQMGEAFKNGMVMIMSIWIDNSSDHMGWLDAGDAGPCISSQDTQANIKANQPDTTIIYSNIRTGELGSTTSLVSANA